MRRSLRRGLVFLLLTAAAACTQDFSSFRFVDTKPARDLHDSSTARDAGHGEDDAGASVVLDATHSEPQDRADAQAAADASVSDASQGQNPPAAGASAEPQPPTQSLDAGADEDAGPEAPTLSLGEQCTVGWPDLKTGSAICRYCACNSCAAPIVDCLNTGDPTQRALCRAVLACAVRTHCKDGACYCTGDGCGYPNASGDGPCVAEIEAAVGGKRTRVTQLRQLDPPPRDQPYIRAITAITCLYGSDDASPGPTVMEQCSTSCGR
jgi:hypothetical protein